MKPMAIGREALGILGAVVVLVVLSQVLGGAGVPLPAEAIPLDGEAAAKDIASRLSLYGFDPSLDAKEAVDFLLTPALLVQEDLSDDVVLTYPTE